MSNKKVLIIDDDEEIRKALSLRLKANDYTVRFAVDGMTAIQMARQERPDVILLDLGLPGGDGFVVLQRLKQNVVLSSIPVIVVTAKDPQGNQERALSAGADAFFQKPFESAELLEAIRAA